MNFVTVLFFLALLLTILDAVLLLRLTGKNQTKGRTLWPFRGTKRFSRPVRAVSLPAEESIEEHVDSFQPEEPEPESEQVSDSLSPEPESMLEPESAPEPAPQKRRPSVVEILLLVCTAFLVILGLADLFGLADFAQYENGFLLLGLTALAEYGVCLFLLKRPSRTLHFFGKLLLAASVLEVTLFQFPSYHLLLGDYPQKVLLPTEATMESGNYSIDENTQTITMIGKDEVVITFRDVNQPIGTVQLQARFGDNTEHVKVVLDASDETHQEYRYDYAVTDLIQDRDNTAYITCQLSGNVQNFRVKFTGYDDDSCVLLRNVQLNVPVPFQVSPLRLALILLLGTLAYGIVCSTVLRKPFAETQMLCKRTAIGITLVAMALATAIVMVKLPDGGITQQLHQSSGNQITQEQVDAFEAGQIHLLKEPSEELLALENPYDWGLRNDSGVQAEWDHVMYDGKYYSYYGIAPVILLYLPYHKLTGYYCSTNLSILLFCLIGLVCLTMTYLTFIRQWGKRVPAGCVIGGLVILLSACGIWFSAARTLFYEISISSGFAFTTLGAYFLLSSNLLGKEKVKLNRTALASLFLGIAVLCRPTLAVYAIVACIYFICAIPKAGHVVRVTEEGSVNGVSNARRVGYIFCAVLPLAALGIFQMWYNNARFDSPLDFGIQYSLTINDFTHSQYHTHFVLIALLNYLFAVPSFSAEYPFITTPFSKMNVNGYYFSDVGNTSGILFLALPVFAYLLSRRALKRLPDRKTRWKYALMIGLPCMVMPLVIICSIWESGYAVRYTADFSWQIILGAYAVLFFLYQNSQNETKKEWVRIGMAGAMICAVLVNGIQIFNFAFSQDQYPALCDHLTQLIAFWK